MALLPENLQNLGKTLSLPEPDVLQILFGHELLIPYLQRSLLEALAAHGHSREAPCDDELTRVAKQVGLNDANLLDSWCSSNGISITTIQTLCSFREQLQQATEAIWGDDVASRFLDRRIELDQAILSVIRFGDADLAQELYFQMLDGETVFAQLVDQYANEPGQPARGLVGPVSLESLHPVLARIAERYDPGALIPPIDINGTVHLVRVEKLEKAVLNDAMRQRLLLEMRQEWLNQQLQLLLDRLGATTAPPTHDTPAE